MNRVDKIREIKSHANKVGLNWKTIVYILAITSDKGVTKLHKEILAIKG
jgi:hypothetical protein